MSENKKAATAGTGTASNTAFIELNSTVSGTLLLARLMPKTSAAIIANGGSITRIAEFLPATAAAISVILS